MLDFLFRRLTADPKRGTDLFEAVTRSSREPHWYVEGDIPDTLDGRFAVLATVTALALVRLESEGEGGNNASVALTERFIEVMEAEHREIGLGDPALGKTVRKLVGSLARRNELWRGASTGMTDWRSATRESLYRSDIANNALEHSSEALERLFGRLKAASLEDLLKGKVQ